MDTPAGGGREAEKDYDGFAPDGGLAIANGPEKSAPACRLRGLKVFRWASMKTKTLQ
jgi:hypothetical protein